MTKIQDDCFKLHKLCGCLTFSWILSIFCGGVGLYAPLRDAPEPVLKEEPSSSSNYLDHAASIIKKIYLVFIVHVPNFGTLMFVPRCSSSYF